MQNSLTCWCTCFSEESANTKGQGFYLSFSTINSSLAQCLALLSENTVLCLFKALERRFIAKSYVCIGVVKDFPRTYVQFCETHTLLVHSQDHSFPLILTLEAETEAWSRVGWPGIPDLLILTICKSSWWSLLLFLDPLKKMLLRIRSCQKTPELCNCFRDINL